MDRPLRGKFSVLTGEGLHSYFLMPEFVRLLLNEEWKYYGKLLKLTLGRRPTV